jgi:hypothetical protein
MKNILFLVMTAFLIVPVVCGQGAAGPHPNGFGALVLNKTSAEDAIRVLGQPASDKTDKLDASKLAKWLDPKHKEKIFRQLAFKNVGDFSRIQLSFMENSLVMIELEFKRNVAPEHLDKIFSLQFNVIGAASGPSDLPNEVGRYPARFIPEYYPFTYNLIGISEDVFILADISTGDAARPGRIDRTRQISRVLQKK